MKLCDMFTSGAVFCDACSSYASAARGMPLFPSWGGRKEQEAATSLFSVLPTPATHSIWLVLQAHKLLQAL